MNKKDLLDLLADYPDNTEIILWKWDDNAYQSTKTYLNPCATQPPDHVLLMDSGFPFDYTPRPPKDERKPLRHCITVYVLYEQNDYPSTRVRYYADAHAVTILDHSGKTTRVDLDPNTLITEYIANLALSMDCDWKSFPPNQNVSFYKGAR